MIMAPPLNLGDRIGLAAPSGAVSKAAFLKGVELLERWGFKVVYRKDILNRHRYFAGSHRRRLRELQTLIDREDIGAILFPRGGFGLHHVLPDLKLSRLQHSPKRIIAYSDLTMLLERIRSEIGLVTYYGPTVCALGVSANSRVRREYQEILLGPVKNLRWTVSKPQILRHGRTTGKLVGGCLSLLNMSIGTSFEFNAANGILLLEDINEAPYRFERLLLHLKQSGKLRRVRGLIISATETGTHRSSHSEWYKMLKELLSEFRGPIVLGFPCGHAPNPHILPLGMKVCMDTYHKKISLLNG